MAYYIDSSAALKLVVSEPETQALASWIIDRTVLASDLVRTETLRAARRHSPAVLGQARVVLSAFMMMALTSDVCERAAELDPLILRSLDAIHLACALQLGHELDGIITYDQRMTEACERIGVTAIAPS